MKYSPKDKSQAGMARILVVLLVVVAVIGIIVSISYMTRSKEPSTDQNTADTSTLEGRNTSRKTDATNLLASGTNFVTKNNGSLPTKYVSGVLMGASGTSMSAVELEIYPTVTVTQAKQAPVSSDQLRLVTAATCGDKGATVAGSTGALAVQYTQEKAGGTFTAECLDN